MTDDDDDSYDDDGGPGQGNTNKLKLQDNNKVKMLDNPYKVCQEGNIINIICDSSAIKESHPFTQNHKLQSTSEYMYVCRCSCMDFLPVECIFPLNLFVVL